MAIKLIDKDTHCDIFKSCQSFLDKEYYQEVDLKTKSTNCCDTELTETDIVLVNVLCLNG